MSGATRVSHVTHVITGLGQGGAEAMLHKLLVAARRLDPGVQQQVISLTDLGLIGPRLQAAGIPVHALGLRSAVALPLAWSRLCAALGPAGRGQVVQTWMYHADLLGGLAARRTGRRAVLWNLRTSGISRDDISRSTRQVVRACAWLSARVPARIVSNSAAAVKVHVQAGYDPSRFVLLPNGFDTAVFARRTPTREALRRSWGCDDSSVVFGLVARWDVLKDHATFVAAAARVRQALPAARFVLVGHGIPQAAALGALIDSAGLGPAFVRLPGRDDVPELMSAFDVACLSSRAEGFPNVLGEAMACETPVLSTDAGDAAQIVDDAARIAPIGDAAALAACMLRLGQLTAHERSGLGQRDRQRVVTHYGIDAVWCRYRALYDQVLHEQQAAA